MTKQFISSLVIAATVSIVAIDAQAQRPGNPNRGQNRLNKNDRQVNRPREQFPNAGRNREPLGNTQLGGVRPGARNPNARRELQRRVMQAIGLTPQQHLRMQEIRRNHEDEAIAAGRRIRQARAALDRAIMSEPYNEAVINNAIEEMAGAQAAKTRLEARVRAQMRSVLTSEQVMRYHELDRQFRQQRRRQIQQQQQDDREMGLHLMEAPGPSPLDDVEEFDLLALLLWID